VCTRVSLLLLLKKKYVRAHMSLGSSCCCKKKSTIYIRAYLSLCCFRLTVFMFACLSVVLSFLYLHDCINVVVVVAF